MKFVRNFLGVNGYVRLLGWLLTLTVGLFLSACEGLQDRLAGLDGREPEVAGQDESVESDSQAEPLIEPPLPPKKPERLAVMPPQDGSADTPAQETMDPEQLVGMDPVQAVRLLGKPASVREEAPATVWAYQNGNDCRLELFFYLDLETERLRTLGYELVVNDTTGDAERACLQRLVASGGSGINT